ncbi:hypothetical protein CONPUDRAFT_168481 [Coniophora puteana RWD-64-598 SS2]|uniref:Uncharacterized protein n=1 Tax=Coniophora puteana (strain RWD-64-598) TaxID=741705 RepID=A0A5M3MCT3_CONPW|nr:uncharacterized protein CONPUDRAFT_168481 [Coniophora puteana RWD-64-598 SS2]EIW76660.1 hypothetical protein CONPUDRAFT_168481 [Coniophora puteana RWD-64-598 SS2]
MSASQQGLPPLASEGVFTSAASIDIDAPRDIVWDVLMDWDAYHEWNPFVRGQRITDKSKNPLARAPQQGDYLYIHPVHIPPTFEKKRFPSSTFINITAYDPSMYRVAWGGDQVASWLLHTERWQALSELDGGQRTRYESIEAFSGVLAYIIKVILKGGLDQGAQAMADGLKNRSEEKWRIQQAASSS